MKRLFSLLLLLALLAIAAFAAQFQYTPSAPFEIPVYEGKPYTILNENEPDFPKKDQTAKAFELYSSLDVLGRCGAAYANICPELMPSEERGPIGQIKPSGWQTARYDDLVEGKYLYNRCHLIGFQLTGENANELNLITGTRHMNVEGMQPFENMVAEYVEKTGNHVLYRVTPHYKDSDLVVRGVQMEALSVEDTEICFNVFVHNIQPGITIDYATGESRRTAEPEVLSPPSVSPMPDGENSSDSDRSTNISITQPDEDLDYTYILNKRSMKFHDPSCSGAKTISEKNRGTSAANREELIAQGYSPCGQCKP